ncbi:MAG: type I pullulanase, partial [Tidjanibacter sp.]|nr:type I pullulanase [Tidjanibacter sp.]
MACNTKPIVVGDYATYPEYTKGDLGLTYTPAQSVIKLWAPDAQGVVLSIYENGTGGKAIEQIEMTKGVKGTWSATLAGDRKGQFYTFQVTTLAGKTLAETPGVWNKAVGVNGLRAAIVDMAETNPEGWADDKSPKVENFTDIVLYEMHHRDFSIADNSGITNKGKFLALTEQGTKTPEGLASGIDHLKELGITHVQLMPSYDYGSIDEAHLEQNNYNWGYDPKNYNAPEGGYSTNPFEPTVRIREMKQMVKALHDAGIGVVMDVVYNHTYINDGSNFSLTVPGYYYRQNEEGDYSNASGCGNETASDRAMVRHYIAESVKYWATEYHIDGFRFDLMAIHDIETMNFIRAELDKINPGITIHGEGWMASSTPLPVEQQANKANGKKFPGIAVFSDDIRDGLRGEWMSAGTGGFASGIVGNRQKESIKFGVVGATEHPQIDYAVVNYSNAPYANHPTEVVNYVSCHDDECLRDKIHQTSSNLSAEQQKRIDLLAQTIVVTAQGVPFIFCGEELYRTKQNIRNTYNQPDEINQIDWS